MSERQQRQAMARRDLFRAVVGAPLLSGGWLQSMRLPHSPARQTLGRLLDPHDLGVGETIERVRDGSLKAEACATWLLARYEAHQGLQVAHAIDPARILETARAIDRARSRGERLGPAAGLVFAVKDQISVAGYPTTAGNGALKGFVPRRSASVVARLVAVGASPFCMTAVPDMVVSDGLMHQVSSHNASFPTVRNPYDRTRVPGGSSGGNGAALAARIVPAALGLDTNGSVRLPSAFCGVVGLRPSTFTIDNALRGERRKRYSDDGVLLPPVGRLDTIGPMARSVADVALLDSLITGHRVKRLELRNLRIAVPRKGTLEQDWVDSDVARVIESAFDRLRHAGCRLVEIDFAAEVRAIVGRIDAPSVASIMAERGLGARLQSSETMAIWLRENVPGVTVEKVYSGRPVRRGSRTLPSPEDQIALLREASRRYSAIFSTHRIRAIAYPTVPILPPHVRQEGPKEPFGEVVTINGRMIEEGRVLAQNLFVAPRLGAPALSLPAGIARGLPVGLELLGLPGRDTELLGVGTAVEEAIGRIPGPILD